MSLVSALVSQHRSRRVSLYIERQPRNGDLLSRVRWTDRLDDLLDWAPRFLHSGKHFGRKSPVPESLKFGGWVCGLVYRILPFANWSDLLRGFLREGFCYLIPRKERLAQGKVRLDGLLDLVKSEAEFTPLARWSFTPRLRSSRGKCRAQCG